MDEQQAELINLRAKNAELAAQVRDLQQAEAAAEAASEAKTRFLAMVSHEIRTPLSGIIGLADLLALGQLDQEQRAYVEAIRGAGGALVSLLSEILDLSRVEAGRLDLEDAPYDIVALVEGAAELLAPRAQGKGLEIASYVAPNVPRILMGDGARIRQIMLNLAGNSAKFTQAGGIGLSVRVVEENLVIEVADTGPGVPEDRRAAIFEDFEQADSSSARSHEGAGLGLAISRRLAERLGGSLTLARSGSQGSVFAFACRLRPAPEQPPAPEGLCGQSVLLVGASSFELPFIAQRLRDRRVQAHCAADFAEAKLALFQTQNQNQNQPQNLTPKIVIVDCALGVENARAIAAQSRLAGVERVLTLFSPFERRALGAQALASMDGWLVKPVREASLRALILEQGEPEQGEFETDLAPAKGETPLARMHILLAEDNPINALVARKHLESLGASVRHVSDGRAAVLAAMQARMGEAPPIDAILMDMRMPDLDGPGAARLIREEEAASGAARVRIVALTANAFAQDRRECLEAGVDDFLTKPFEPRTLARILKPVPGGL